MSALANQLKAFELSCRYFCAAFDLSAFPSDGCVAIDNKVNLSLGKTIDAVDNNDYTTIKRTMRRY